MKIMTINVWQGRLLRPLLELIRTEAPDVIMTQEMYSYPHSMPGNSPWSFFSTLEVIARQHTYDHNYFSPSSTFTMFGQELLYGNAILSKHAFGHTSTHSTGGSGVIHYDSPTSFGTNASRNFQHVTIHAGGSNLNIINHHGHWVNQSLGDEVSSERLRLVSDYIATLDGPTVVGGDFNLSPHSPAMAEFIRATGLVDLAATTGVTSTLSAAHYVHRDVVCDYLLTSPELDIARTEVLETLVSDHKAIVTEINS